MADSKAAAAAAPAKDTPGAAKPAAKKQEPQAGDHHRPAVLLVSIAAGAFFLLRTPADASAAGDARSADKGKGDKETEGGDQEAGLRRLRHLHRQPQGPGKVPPDQTDVPGKNRSRRRGTEGSDPGRAQRAHSRAELAGRGRSHDQRRQDPIAKQLVDAASQALAGGELKDTLEAVLITHMIIQ